MGKAATEPGRQGSRPANEAEPPLKSLVEGPLSPTRSTNIAESSREPGGRLSAADELAVRYRRVLRRQLELALQSDQYSSVYSQQQQALNVSQASSCPLKGSVSRLTAGTTGEPGSAVGPYETHTGAGA